VGARAGDEGCARRAPGVGGKIVRRKLARTLARGTIERIVAMVRTCPRRRGRGRAHRGEPARRLKVPKIARTHEPWTYLTQR
jgi:hypothetical protein